MTKKKRKGNNNYINNNSQKNKKNLNAQKKEKTLENLSRRNFLKLGLKVALGLGIAGLGFYAIKNILPQNREEIYERWMEHYDEEGILIEDLEQKSKKVKDFLTNIRNSTNAQELTDKLINIPYNKFLQSSKHYENYSLNVMSVHYIPCYSEVFIDELYKKCFNNQSNLGKLKGLKEVEDYFIKNYYDLMKKEDEELAFWALNAAYFITRKNFKASTFVNSNSKEDLEKAFEKNIGDCEILSYFTEELYLTLIRELKRKHLSKRLIRNNGFLLDKEKNQTIGHVWLTFYSEGKTSIVETNSFLDDALFDNDKKYDPNKIYIRGYFLNCLYIL